MSTKDRILDVALTLFNERGTDNVTTNHIAEALGMSPGNLYYHYRNKAEIVRALFARIQAEWSVNYAVPQGRVPDLSLMEAMLAGNFAIQARYRFFFRDLTLLINADPELASVYRGNREAGIANTRFLIQLFVDVGVLESPGDAEAINDLTQLLWLVGDFWLVFKEFGGTPFTQADSDHRDRMCLPIIAPTLKGN